MLTGVRFCVLSRHNFLVITDELDDILILDAPTIALHVIYLDGTVQEKAMQEDFSIELYKRFLPYFEKY